MAVQLPPWVGRQHSLVAASLLDLLLVSFFFFLALFLDWFLCRGPSVGGAATEGCLRFPIQSEISGSAKGVLDTSCGYVQSFGTPNTF